MSECMLVTEILMKVFSPKLQEMWDEFQKRVTHD